MATTLTGSLKVSFQVSDVRTSVTGAAKEGGSRAAAGDYSWTIANGTGTGQADKMWSDTRSLATAGNESLDLAGTLTNAFGETVTFVKVRAIVFSCAAANTTTLTISRPASNGLVLFGAASGALAAISAGGGVAFWDPAGGVAVTAGTGDLLTITNSAGATAYYDIAIVGTSA